MYTASSFIAVSLTPPLPYPSLNSSRKRKKIKNFYKKRIYRKQFQQFQVQKKATIFMIAFLNLISVTYK